MVDMDKCNAIGSSCHGFPDFSVQYTHRRRKGSNPQTADDAAIVSAIAFLFALMPSFAAQVSYTAPFLIS